jgi:hypothetical protein
MLVGLILVKSIFKELISSVLERNSLSFQELHKQYAFPKICS